MALAMEIRQPSNSKDAKHYDTDRLREEFLIEEIFVPGEIRRIYSHIDRIITMGYTPTDKPLELGEGLNTMTNLGTDFFLERRELGVINIGGKGAITVDGKKYVLNPRDGLYVGMGAKEVVFESDDKNAPAKFYTLSAPAHTTYPPCTSTHQGPQGPLRRRRARQQARHQPVHSSGSHEELPAHHGPDPAGRGQRVEHMPATPMSAAWKCTCIWTFRRIRWCSI